MPTFKVKQVFGSFKSGWSELYYLTMDDLDAAIRRAQVIATMRTKLLGTGSYMENIIVSDDAISGDSQIASVGLDGEAGDDPTDTPWNAILVRAEASPLYRRSFYLRGVPDDWIKVNVLNGRVIFPASARLAVANWAAEMTRGPAAAQMKVVLKGAPTGTPIKVTGQPTQAGGFTSFTIPSFLGLVGEKLQFKKWKGPDGKYLNRTWDIIAAVGNLYTTNIPWTALTDPALDYNGVAIAKRPGYATMNRYVLLRPTSKRTGRAFFVSPGRRKTRTA